MGKLIVLEGGDGSGKETQTKLLVNELLDEGLVAVFDFPQYEDNVFGRTIKRALKGDFGNFLDVSPYIASTLYMLDRASARDRIADALKKGHVICNRYVPSNLAHQAAKLPRRQWGDFIEYVDDAEYCELELPRPDLVVYLDVPAEIASKLLAKKKRTKDQAERNLQHQRDVAAVYHFMCQRYDDWSLIRCVRDGKLLSPEAIHQLVLKAVRPVLR